MKKGIKIGTYGFVIESLGLAADILHHLDIGIETPEGLLTWQHSLILIGFIVMSWGLWKIRKSS